MYFKLAFPILPGYILSSALESLVQLLFKSVFNANGRVSQGAFGAFFTHTPITGVFLDIYVL